MGHDEAFAAFQARKREQEASTVKVTWRKARQGVNPSEQLHSGLGPGGRLVYAVQDDLGPSEWRFGTIDRSTGNRRTHGHKPTLAQAKAAAEQLLTTEEDRC